MAKVRSNILKWANNNSGYSIFLAVIIFAGVSLVTGNSSSNLADSVYKNYAGITSMAGWFTQTTYLDSETREISAKFEYETPKYRIRLFEPEERTVIFTGDTFLVRMPDRNRVVFYTDSIATNMSSVYMYATIFKHNLFEAFPAIEFQPVAAQDSVFIWQGEHYLPMLEKTQVIQLAVDKQSLLFQWLAVFDSDSTLQSMTYYQDYQKLRDDQNYATRMVTLSEMQGQKIRSEVVLSRLQINSSFGEEVFATKPLEGEMVLTNPK